MTKAELENKKALSKALFMSGMDQVEIAQRVDVSRNTVSKWCTEGHWKEARAAKSVTRPELVNKLLLTIDQLIEQVRESEDPVLMASLGDKLAKLSSVIEKLDKKANLVDAVEVFMAFSRWLEMRAKTDTRVSPEFIKALNEFQDQYLGESISKGALA